MHVENLVKMINEISAFFQAEPDKGVAVHGIADHLRKFWDPRMRKEIIAYGKNGGVGLCDLAKDAVVRLEQETNSAANSG